MLGSCFGERPGCAVPERARAGMRGVLQDALRTARIEGSAWARGRGNPRGQDAGIPEGGAQGVTRGVRARGRNGGDSARGFARGFCVDGRHAGRCWVCRRRRAGGRGACTGGPGGRRRLFPESGARASQPRWRACDGSQCKRSDGARRPRCGAPRRVAAELSAHGWWRQIHSGGGRC